MRKIEQELKLRLEAMELETPSLELDEKIEALINQSEKVNVSIAKSSWKSWSIAASIFAIVLVGTLINFQDKKDPLQLAFEESFSLEQQIKTQKPTILQPVFFMQESKINQEISEIDRQLQLLLLLEDSNDEVLDLMKTRVRKLQLLQDLYQTSQPVYRI